MSKDTTNYIRDKNGQWWIANSKGKPLIEFAYSEEMEFAYKIGLGDGARLATNSIVKVIKEDTLK